MSKRTKSKKAVYRDKAAARAPAWLRDIAASKRYGQFKKKPHQGTFGPASECVTIYSKADKAAGNGQAG